MKKSYLTLAIVLVFIGVANVALGQPPAPPSPAAVPIDGGLGFLLVAGAGLGAKKAWDLRKQKSVKKD